MSLLPFFQWCEGSAVGNAIRTLAGDIQPWLVASLAVMLVTGAGLFMSESIKCYYSTPFRVKMLALALAIVFTFTVRRNVTMAEGTATRPMRQRIVAVISLALWFAVAASGRWIGFSG